MGDGTQRPELDGHPAPARSLVWRHTERKRWEAVVLQAAFGSRSADDDAHTEEENKVIKDNRLAIVPAFEPVPPNSGT
ncbi:unnamed protein product [Dibothriocephalus latus]|uniref:Uncharacterized protein n=1 Tax=Dibothriocephalus latus TaxID=60516 RepID=A0A3P7P1E1_DIBLA|nr:unnamed protein product [Dibothriocephalus latus]